MFQRTPDDGRGWQYAQLLEMLNPPVSFDCVRGRKHALPNLFGHLCVATELFSWFERKSDQRLIWKFNGAKVFSTFTRLKKLLSKVTTDATSRQLPQHDVKKVQNPQTIVTTKKNRKKKDKAQSTSLAKTCVNGTRSYANRLGVAMCARIMHCVWADETLHFNI